MNQLKNIMEQEKKVRLSYKLPSEMRTKRVVLYVTEAEHMQLQRKARESQQSVASLLRRLSTY